MDVNTTENGQTICKTDLDNLSMLMESFSMVNGLMELRTEMVNNNGKMVPSTLEIGLTIPCKELVTTSLPTEASMKVNGLIISSMEKEHKPGQMVELT